MSNSAEAGTPGAPPAPAVPNQGLVQPHTDDSSSDSNSTVSLVPSSQAKHSSKKSSSKSRTRVKAKSKVKVKSKSKSTDKSTEIDSSTDEGSDDGSQSESDSGECDSSSFSNDNSSVNIEPNESFHTTNATLTIESIVDNQSANVPNDVATRNIMINGDKLAVVSASVELHPVVLPAAPSPIAVTPAKSLQLDFKTPPVPPVVQATPIWNSTPATVNGPVPVPVPSIDASTVAVAVAKALADPNFDQGIYSTAPTAVATGVMIPVDAAGVSGLGSRPVTSDSLGSKKKVRKSADQIKEERYARKLRKLESALRRAEMGRIKSTKTKKRGGKQRKQHKRKSKHARRYDPGSSSSESSDDSSSSSSAPPSEPEVVNRIPRIPQGRALQQIAMSRVKELGLERDIENRAAELSESLRLIDHIEIPVTMDMAYRHFHQVPGTGLPHLQKHIVDFAARYSRLVRSVVKFHLIQAQKLNSAKREALGPEADNPFVHLWQFKNDFARAPSTAIQLQQPPALPPVAPTPAQQVHQPSTLSSARPKHERKSHRKLATKTPKKRKAKKDSTRPTPSRSGAALKRSSSMRKGSKRKKETLRQR